jgi:hypothetical protein
MPVTGQQVLVREPEANLVAVGIIDHIDTAAQVIYIAVDWAQMAPDEIPTPDEFVSRIGHLGGNLARSPITRQIVGEATPQTA